ncbi:MAG: PfkB family carbohydrate kinase, partial [Planctomycetota bacterium]
LKLLILTRGGEGSLLRTPEETSEHPGVDVDVVSTVGAGDSFTAGVVGGWLSGMSLTALHDHASRLSAFVCTQPGAMPELPGEFRIAG